VGGVAGVPGEGNAQPGLAPDSQAAGDAGMTQDARCFLLPPSSEQC
jgi:hypothetical protein